jgi:hypothetical protein
MFEALKGRRRSEILVKMKAFLQDKHHTKTALKFIQIVFGSFRNTELIFSAKTSTKFDEMRDIRTLKSKRHCCQQF